MAKEKEAAAEPTVNSLNVRLSVIETRMNWAPAIATVVLIGIGWYVNVMTDQSEDIKDMLKAHDKEAHEAREKLEERIKEIEREQKQSWMDQLRNQWEDRNTE